MNQQHVTPEQIVDYLHRELAPEADAALLVHLESCAACAALFDQQARLSEALRTYARESERELPQGVVARIWDAVERDQAAPTFAQRLALVFRPVYAVPIAAVLVIGAFFGYTATHHAVPVTTIDAAVYLRDHASLNSTMPFGDGAAESALRGEVSSASDEQWVASTGTSLVAESR